MQLAVLHWDLNGAMDREVCATEIHVAVENTGKNVVLEEVMHKEIITNSGNVYIYGGGGGEETEDQGKRGDNV